MTRAMWGLSLSLEPPPKQQVPGSFRVWEQRSVLQSRAPAADRATSLSSPTTRPVMQCWSGFQELHGCPRPGREPQTLATACPVLGAASVLPAPAQPPHAHHPASLWKPACVPWVPVHEPEALGGHVTPAPEPKLCCPQSLNLACPLWDPTGSRAATAGASSPPDCPDYPQPRALGSRT